MLRRFTKAIMTSTPKRVPIPKNGVDYRGKIVLAPMVRSGELPSRLLALHYGADLVWGPETVDRSMIGTTRKLNAELNTVDFTRLPSNGHKSPSKEQKESLIFRIHPEKEGRKLIFQIGTSDPERAVAAAKLVAKDVAGIDVNAGCPKPFSTSGGMGAALLKTPDVLASILEALVKEVASEFEIGISVKIRLLETPEETESLVRKLCSTGITGLTIHCRTTPMRPRERAIRKQLKMIASVCHEYGVACLMNGDVESREAAEALMPEFGADGAMIATAAETNSSVFRSKADGGPAPWRDVCEEYLKLAMDVENRWGNTKYLLAHLTPGKHQRYREVTQSKNYSQACTIYGLDHLMERAKLIDQKLDLVPEIMDQTRAGKKRKNKDAQMTAVRAKADKMQRLEEPKPQDPSIQQSPPINIEHVSDIKKETIQQLKQAEAQLENHIAVSLSA